MHPEPSLTLDRVSSSGGDRGEASPPIFLASPPKNLTLIKLSIIVPPTISHQIKPLAFVF